MRPARLLSACLAALCPLAAAAAEPRIVQFDGHGSSGGLALRDDGSVVGWGEFDHGQLGHAPRRYGSSHSAAPTLIPLPGRAVQIASANSTNYALMADGRLLAWGNGAGLGTGAAAPLSAAKAGTLENVGVRMERALDTAESAERLALQAERAANGDLRSAISLVGGLFSRRPRTQAAAAAPAENRGGFSPIPVPDPSELPPDSPDPVVVPLTGVKQIAACCGVAVAVMQDGTVRAWGSRAGGRIGDGLAAKGWGNPSAPALSPVVVPGVSGIVQVDVGGNHVLALQGDGRIVSWGSNRGGELGRAPAQEPPMDTPGMVEGIDGVTRVVTGGSNVSMALRRDGSLWVWGHNSHGQFANGEFAHALGLRTGWELRPQQVAGVSGVEDVVLGSGNVLARLRDGRLLGWGNTDWGTLGVGKRSGYEKRQVVVPVPDAVQVLAGHGHTYVVKRDGSTWGMGQGGDGYWQRPANSGVPSPIRLSP